MMFPIDDSLVMPHLFYAYKAAKTNPNTLYHHQAMKEPDRADFIVAMQK